MQIIEVVRNLVTVPIFIASVLVAVGCEPALLTPLDEEGGNNSTVNNGTTNNTAPNNGGTTENPYEGQMEAAVDGEALYSQSACQTCHGPMGEGTASFPALDMTAMLSDAEIFDVIYSGRVGTAMSAYGDANGGPLTEDDTWKVVTFVRTLEE